jgi:hypothetical protein
MDEDETQAAAAPEPEAKKPAAAKKKSAAKAKGKGKDKDKASKKGEASNNPRAAANVRRAKGWGGLTGFIVAAYLSHVAGAPFVVIGTRALIAGIACYIVGWAVAVTVYRHLMIGQAYGAIERMRDDRTEQPS